jgi:hypothetical protein
MAKKHLGPGKIHEKGVSGDQLTPDISGDFAQHPEFEGSGSVQDIDPVSRPEMASFQPSRREIDASGGEEEFLESFLDRTVRCRKKVDSLDEKCPVPEKDGLLEKGGHPEGKIRKSPDKTVHPAVGQIGSGGAQKGEVGRAFDMVHGISEGSDRALVGPEDCQYNGCSQGDSKEGQESRRLVF